MPLAYPVYRRYLKGDPRNSKTLSPRVNIALAMLFVLFAIMHAADLALRNHKNVWDIVFHIAIATVWLTMSVDYVRRATGKKPLM
jgi:antibiotic biosynthesis monooxygenase (ABM) superfamily enzyme